jgi:23S rRNA (uracil1939-C5)-methyltransferase
MQTLKSPTVRCAHVGICGGCSSQHVPYEEQLLQKEKNLRELFPEAEIAPIIGCEDPWRYRGKMEFSFREDKEKNHYLGLMRVNGRGRVENIDECFIAPKWMHEALSRCRKWWKTTSLEAFFPPKDSGSLRTLTLRSGNRGESQMVILTVSGRAEYALSQEEIDSFKEALSITPNTSIYIIIQRAKKGEPTRFYEMHLKGPSYLEETLFHTPLRLSPRAFFQPNVVMAERMFGAAIEMLNLSGKEKVLDLCCGIGTIGIALSPHVAQVIGVELSVEAVTDGRENIERLGLENIQLFAEDAGAFLKANRTLFQPDIVVVDPPRTGLGKEVIAYIEEISPKQILYVSCNPKTQKEDIEHLKGYNITFMRPFDQFPHTPHMENLALLTRIHL